MKLHRRLFASALILLLSPMAANAVLITYTSNDLGSGYYLTAEVDITAPDPGLYSVDNGGLTSFLLSAFDSNDVLQFTASANPNPNLNNYVSIDGAGALHEWFLFGEEPAPLYRDIYTIYQQGNSTGGCCEFLQEDAITDPAVYHRLIRLQGSSGVWASVPEPGTLGLLAAGIGGFIYRRKTVSGRV